MTTRKHVSLFYEGSTKCAPLIATACVSPVQAQARQDHSMKRRGKHEFPPLVEKSPTIYGCWMRWC